MFYELCQYFLIFLISSILGYFVEITFCAIQNHKFSFNRGFLLGPYIPIYGIGVLLMGVFLSKYREDPFVFFWMTVILCSFIEYITSYIMEKLFKVRWWDYSSEPFNYNGRICLKNSMLFGIAGLIIIYTFYPFLLHILKMIPPFLLELATIFLFLIFCTDFIFTTITLFKVKSNLLKIENKDATEEAHKEVMRAVKQNGFLFNRLLQIFPRNEKFNRNAYSELKKAVFEYQKKKKEKARLEKSSKF